MGKGKRGGSARAGSRSRLNPRTGLVEQVAGTKAGKKRSRLAFGDPLRTHDLRPPRKVRKGSEPLPTDV
jgi:hypothetical protein